MPSHEPRRSGFQVDATKLNPDIYFINVELIGGIGSHFHPAAAHGSMWGSEKLKA